MNWKLNHFEEIDSTNTQAKRRIQSGKVQSGDVIYADIQTASYGRRGRAWQSAKGNLLASIILKKPHDLAQIPFVFGVALWHALNQYADETQILKLKWPNDILLNDGKLVGVLLEVEEDYLIIGFGVNVVVAPQTDQNVATLDKAVETRDILEKVLACFENYHQQWLDEGFEPIRQIWLTHAHGVGQKIVARFPDGQEKTGIFDDISAHGELIMRHDNNNAEHISTADIFFG